MLFKKLGHDERIRIMRRHTQPKGLQATPQEPGLKWMKYRPMHTRIFPGAVDQMLGAHQRACGDVGMSIEVFGGAMYHQVIAEFEWSLIVRRGERIISYG